MTTYVFIDASNLFYGGKKSLGWSIDYEKLKHYLETKYEAAQVFYFGGVETHKFFFDYINLESIPIRELQEYLKDLVLKNNGTITNTELELIHTHLKRVQFYVKLEKLGYRLILKPVKTYYTHTGDKVRKANCDVDMTYTMMRERNAFDKILVLSGDGDFLPVLKHLRSKNKEVIVLSRSERTAKEIKQFAGGEFRDFHYIKKHIQFENKNDL